MQFINSKEAGAWVTTALDLIQQHLTWPVLVIMFLMGCAGLVVTYLLFKKYGSRIKITEAFGSENIESSGPNPQLLFFSVDWCPHCKVAQPEWDKLVSDYTDQPINGKVVEFVPYDCTTETAEIKSMTSQYGVDGYPTVILVMNGKPPVKFDAKPTEASMLQFLQASL